MTTREYVLGTGDDELQRLALQHRLWGDAAHEAWRLARIGPGQRVLDIGCGPGMASFDLAQFVTTSGRVVGVDESPAFIEHLNTQAAARKLPQLSGLVGDVHDLPGVVSGRGPFDIAYARWVLCFVKDPAAVIRGAASLLAPGGRLVVHDYFNYTAMSMAPRRASHDKAVAATAKSWRDRGGDPDIVARLPRLMQEAGLRLEHLHVHQRIARGGETMFHWINVWWRIYTPKLVAMGLLTQADQDQFFKDLDEVGASTTDFVVCPPVYEVIAIKG
jgi:ubiquinone/menaquinone biosynthesis C-methylase UbiE